MALKKLHQKKISGFDQVVEAPAYWRIDSIDGNKNSVNIKANAYVNNVQVDGFSALFVPDLDGTNFIKQAYEHLKSLPEFAGAVDC